MSTTVIITGAGTGIGQALAIKLAASGYNILGVGRRLEPLQQTQKNNPEKIHILQADITLHKDRAKIVGQIENLGKSVYLVHNAHSHEPLGLLKDITLEEWRAQQIVNVEAPLFLTQALLTHLKGGRILNISSGYAHYPCPGIGSYCVSKAALFMLYLCLRDELQELDITVGSAMPGIVDTPMQESLRSTSKDKLPLVKSFIGFKEKNKLIPPAIVADFLKWLLFETNDDEYSDNEWDIGDTTHHSKWLKDKNPRWVSKVKK
jgi:benzil reductase ((S)-benzoin forming)